MLSHLVGTRTLVRIEADVELTRLTYNLAFRTDGLYFTVTDLEMSLARDSSVSCNTAEGGFVEWVLRAVPAKVVDWVKHALQHNLRKEQLLCLWEGDAHALGALDGLSRALARLERLKREAKRRHGEREATPA